MLNIHHFLTETILPTSQFLSSPPSRARPELPRRKTYLETPSKVWNCRKFVVFRSNKASSRSLQFTLCEIPKSKKFRNVLKTVGFHNFPQPTDFGFESRSPTPKPILWIPFGLSLQSVKHSLLFDRSDSPEFTIFEFDPLQGPPRPPEEKNVFRKTFKSVKLS